MLAVAAPGVRRRGGGDLLQDGRGLYLPQGLPGLRPQVPREFPELVPSQVVEGEAAAVDQESWKSVNAALESGGSSIFVFPH